MGLIWNEFGMWAKSEPTYILSFGNIATRPQELTSDVKKGDVVVFNKYGGMELSLGDGEYIFLKQDEVLGIIE